jgi:hypothetical protein
MSIVRILAETEDTITIRRTDWVRVLAALEDAEDRSAIAQRRALERSLGKDVARRLYLTGAEAVRLLDGESPVKIWREKRGLSQRALATEAKIGGGYLAEIETGRKPGSDDAIRKLSVALQVPPEDLDTRRWRMRRPDHGPVVLRLSPVSAGVAAGGRGAWAERMPFATLGDAIDFVRDEWLSLHARSPSVIEDNGSVIYTTEELVREIEGPAAR